MSTKRKSVKHAPTREEQIKEEFFSSPINIQFDAWLIKKLIKTEERTLPSSYHRKKEEKLQDEIKELKDLLKIAKCPYECIGGAIQCGEVDDYWFEPCQWCDEKKQALKTE